MSPTAAPPELVTALRVLHREFERDECCDPPTNGRTCEYATVCEECGYQWPCATVRLLPTPTVDVEKPRAPEDHGSGHALRDGTDRWRCACGQLFESSRAWLAHHREGGQAA